jgi:hypothetical protein
MFHAAVSQVSELKGNSHYTVMNPVKFRRASYVASPGSFGYSTWKFISCAMHYGYVCVSLLMMQILQEGACDLSTGEAFVAQSFVFS